MLPICNIIDVEKWLHSAELKTLINVQQMFIPASLHVNVYTLLLS